MSWNFYEFVNVRVDSAIAVNSMTHENEWCWWHFVVMFTFSQELWMVIVVEHHSMWDTKILSEKGSTEKKCILKNAKYVLVNCMKIIGSKNLSKVSIYSECALLISFPLILLKLLAYFLKMNYTPLYTALCLWCLSSPKRTLTLVRRHAQRNIQGQFGFAHTYFNPIVIRKDRLRSSHRLVPTGFQNGPTGLGKEDTTYRDSQN